MDLKILLPYRIFAEIKNVSNIIAETSEGSFGLLPQRLDCVAAIVPSIFSYETSMNPLFTTTTDDNRRIPSDIESQSYSDKTKSKNKHYIAVDEGILIKAGNNVLVSVRNAFGGTDLGKLHDSVEKEFLNLDDSERKTRSEMAKMESGFICSLEKLRDI